MVKPLEFLRSHYSLQPPAQPSRPRRGPLASDFKRRSALRAQVTSDSSSLVTETPATSPPTIQPALETPSSKQIASKATGKGKTERPFDFGLAPQKPDDSPSLAAPSLHGRRPTPRNVRFGPATKVGGQRKTSYAKILKEEEEWTLEEDSDQDGSDTEVCSDSSGDVEMLFLLPGSELAQNKALARSRHRQDLKQLMAMLERGPLLTSPHHDLIRIVPLLMTAKKRSYRIINRSSRDLTKVVELKIGNYVKQVDKTKSALLNARVRIGGTKSIGRSKTLDSLLERLILLNSRLIENRHSTSQDLKEIQSWISAQLSILSNQWLSASDQYRDAFASASKLPSLESQLRNTAPTSKKSKGGKAGENEKGKRVVRTNSTTQKTKGMMKHRV